MVEDYSTKVSIFLLFKQLNVFLYMYICVVGVFHISTNFSFRISTSDAYALANKINSGWVIISLLKTMQFMCISQMIQISLFGANEAFNLQPPFQKRVEKWFQKSGSANSDYFFWSTTFLEPEKMWIYSIKPPFFLVNHFSRTRFFEPDFSNHFSRKVVGDYMVE